MKLSELIAEHPQLDIDLGDCEETMFLDGVYLFRSIKAYDPPGQSVLYKYSTDHTDGIIARGLVTLAQQVYAGAFVRDGDN